MAQRSILQITTWNVLNPAFEKPQFYDPIAHPFLHWTKGRDKKASQYITKLHSDVFCLQETTQSMCEGFVKALNGAHKGAAYKMIWKQRNMNQNDGCGTLWDSSKLDLEETTSHQYEGNTHIFLATKFSVKESKKPIIVVNTHVNWSQRERDLVTLSGLVTKMEAVPRVAMGDFNAEAKEAWYETAKKSGAVDAYSTANGSHAKFSYHSGKESKFIDFFLIWGTPELQISKALLGNDIETPADLTPIKALPDANIPSDHLPLSVVFSI